jgi:hypothetical protein
VAGLDPTALVFVNQDGEPGGDGSRERPFVTLSDALDGAMEGDILVLAGGTYLVDRRWPDGISARGRCARDTRLTVPDGSSLAAVLLVREHARAIAFEDLTVGPAPSAGLRIGPSDATVVLDGVVIAAVTGVAAVFLEPGAALDARSVVLRDTESATAGAGVISLGGTMTMRRAVVDRCRSTGIAVERGSTTVLEDVVVRDTLPERGNRRLGRGVNAVFGARLVVRRALFEGNRDVALFLADNGTEVTLEDVVVTDTMSRSSDATGGYALDVEFEAQVSLVRGRFERNRDLGIFVGSAGRLDAVDLLMSDTRAQERSGIGGVGISVGPEGRLFLERAAVERNRSAGLTLGGIGAEAVVSDIVVRDTDSEETGGRLGRGISVVTGARLALRRGLVEGNKEVGMTFIGAGTTGHVEDLVVRDTEAESGSGLFGPGMTVLEGAEIVLERALLERNREAGLLVLDSETAVTLSDLVVRDTRPREADDFGGLGVVLLNVSSAVVARALLERNRGTELLVSGDGPDARIDDVAIRDTLANADGLGRGLWVQDGARAEASRLIVERVRQVGVGAFGPESELSVTDLVVRGTAGELLLGANLGSYEEARVSAEKFEVDGSDTCGVHLIGGDLRLRSGLVASHPVAVCLQSAEFPLAQLRENVDYRDNAVLVEATEFEIPDAVSIPDFPRR